jgi:hypothetical protein
MWTPLHRPARDRGRLSTHVTTMTGKAITRAFYGEEAGRSYYTGCSTSHSLMLGGRANGFQRVAPSGSMVFAFRVVSKIV